MTGDESKLWTGLRHPNPPSCDHFGHHGVYNVGAGDLICKNYSLPKPKELVAKRRLSKYFNLEGCTLKAADPTIILTWLNTLVLKFEERHTSLLISFVYLIIHSFLSAFLFFFREHHFHSLDHIYDHAGGMFNQQYSGIRII